MYERLATRSTYEALAAEYYDSSRHPTCANFRQASLLVVTEFLESARHSPTGLWCDLGAGDSVLLEAMDRNPWRVDHRRIMLIDASQRMLLHTPRARLRGERLVLAQVDELPLPDRSVGLVIASLGDPYNLPSFWHELGRVAEIGAVVCYTTPSYQWALSYRTVEGSPDDRARFLLSDGNIVEVDSIILPPERQVRMCENSGFVVDQIVEISVSQLVGPISPKLKGFDKAVTGFVCRRLGGCSVPL